MKKLLLILMLCAPLWSQTTPNLNLNIPPYNSTGWNTLINTNFSNIDSYLSGGLVLPPFKAAGLTLTSPFLTLTGSTSGSATLRVSATGSLLQLNGTTTTVDVSGNELVGGTLGVTGTTTLSGNATVGGTLGVTGTTALSAGLTGTTGTFSGNVTSPSILTGADCGTTTTCANTSLAKPYVVTGKVTLSTGSATITGISPPFGSTNFRINTEDNTNVSNGSNCVPASASSISCSGTGSDVLTYIAVGSQ